MPDQPAAPRPPFLTSLRLPAHRLEIDEDEFLRLLAGCASLHKIEKRMIIRSVPRFSQYQADALIRLLEDELIEQERRNAFDPQRRQGCKSAWNS